MEIIRAAERTVLRKSGLTARQLLFPEKSDPQRVTVTHVLVAPGAKNSPHRHAGSEQICVALQGFENTSGADFEYLAVTSPPVDFRSSYKEKSK